MRLFVSLVATLLIWSNAMAQDAPASAAALHSARVVSDVFTDPIFVAQAADVLSAERADEFSTPLLTGPFYENLRPDTQRALTAYVDTIPQLLREELLTTMSQVNEELAQRLIARFEERELVALATVFSHPQFRAVVLENALASVRRENATWTFEESPELEAIFEAAREQGAPHPWDVLRVVGEANAIAQLAMRPRLQLRLLRGLCGAMADECPAHAHEMITALESQ